MKLGLICTKVYGFVGYTPLKCFNNFVQSAVNARRHGDEKTNSSVVAETMKLLANGSYGYQSLDRSHHSITSYMNDERTHAAINSKIGKKLVLIDDQFHEVPLGKSEIRHEEPKIIGFVILHYAKLRMVELDYMFLQKFATLISMWRPKWKPNHCT